MASDRPEGDAVGGEVGCVQLAFESAFSDRDDAPEDGSALQEGDQVGHEAGAGVVTQGGQQVDLLRGFCSQNNQLHIFGYALLTTFALV